MTRANRAPITFRLGPLPILVLAIATLYFAREILIPLAFALTLTLVLSPPVDWLRKLRVARFPAVLIVILLAVSAAGTLAWVMVNQLIEVASELPNYSENIHRKLEAMHTPAKGALGRAAASIEELGKELSGTDAAPAAGSSPPVHSARRGTAGPALPNGPLRVEVVERPHNGLEYARELIKTFVAPLGLAGIVLIFTIFMLTKKGDLRNRLLRLVGLGQLNVVTQALDDATSRVSRYLLMQFVVNATFALLFSVGLYFIGVPNAIVWGTAAGLLRLLVPYLGTLVALGLPLILSLAVFDTWTPPLLVLGLGLGLELITGNLVEPWLYGAHTGVSSLAILVAAVFWTILWGYAGLILSTPLTVCLLVLGRYVPQLSFLQILLGDEPVLEPQAHLYQRLLAMDQAEARSVVDAFLSDHPLIELYDSVLVPTLTLAEQDRHRGEMDSTREEFLFLSLNELVAEYSDYRPPRAESNSESEAEETTAASEPPSENGRFLCIPAYDQADEIAAAMLAQLLEQQGEVALSFPVSPHASETIALLEPEPKDVICISAVPPYAFAPARKICKQVRSRFPKANIAVGIWGFSGDKDKAKASFERAQPDHLCASFAEVIQCFQPKSPEAEAILVEASE